MLIAVTSDLQSSSHVSNHRPLENCLVRTTCKIRQDTPCDISTQTQNCPPPATCNLHRPVQTYTSQPDASTLESTASPLKSAVSNVQSAMSSLQSPQRSPANPLPSPLVFYLHPLTCYLFLSAWCLHLLATAVPALLCPIPPQHQNYLSSMPPQQQLFSAPSLRPCHLRVHFQGHSF